MLPIPTQEEEEIVDCLPPLVAEKAVIKIQNNVSKFLSRSKFVSLEATKNLVNFDRDELKLGKMLGAGGFSQVCEVKSFSLHRDMGDEEQQKRKALVEKSRRKIKGKSPFVVKQIHSKFLTSASRFKDAAVDLMIEAHYLASLSHPCILEIRGWAHDGARAFASGRTDDFFLVLDRLEETLDERIKQWKKQLTRYTKSALAKINKGSMRELMFAGRLKVAQDIASGLAYLHDCGLIYRDLKPGNVGFNSKSQVKIFDFGLSREIPKNSSTDEVFEMSGKIGTQRYMAPEVYLSKDYNQKADVYSLSLVVWEMLSLSKPFKKHSKIMHRTYVIEGGHRPNVSSKWPYGVQALLLSSWSPDLPTRPTMAEFHSILAHEIQELRSNRNHNSSNNVTTTVPLSSLDDNSSSRLVRIQRHPNGSRIALKGDSQRSTDSHDTYYSSSGDCMVSMDFETTCSEF